MSTLSWSDFPRLLPCPHGTPLRVPVETILLKARPLPCHSGSLPQAPCPWVSTDLSFHSSLPTQLGHGSP